jgi:hypothetical protein
MGPNFNILLGNVENESVSSQQTIEELIWCSSSQFDPWIVEIFVKGLNKPPQNIVPAIPLCCNSNR